MRGKLAIAMLFTSMLLMSCNRAPSYEINGPHSDVVAMIIAVKDNGNIAKLNAMISGVKYTEGVMDQPSATRPVAVSDIPPSDRGNCKLARIIGAGDTVNANWECECCDIALDRQFMFEDGRLVEIRNIYALLG